MPNGALVRPLEVRPYAAYAVAALVAASVVVPVPAAAQSTLKVAFYNIQSGKGEPGMPGHPQPFPDTMNCTDTTQPLNAWGLGLVQRELVEKLGNDPSVVALGLAEAWAGVCGSPENVRKALGWKARSEERNGVAIVARHGFSGPVTFLKLDTSQSTDPEPRYVAHARVCIDASCSATFDVFATHMAAAGATATESMVTQMTQAVSFMAQQAGSRPRAFVGDFNVYEETGGPACGNSPWSPLILDRLRNAGYVDAWRALKGTQPGYTGMVNRVGCGWNDGRTYKRIDYAWSLNAPPLSVAHFGVVYPIGDAAPSDHYGIVAEYPSGQVSPSADVTGPAVSLLAPASGATVGGVVEVSASATDESGVARVEFFAGGSSIGVDSTAPFAVSWDTRTVGNGVHTLQARAVDTVGNSSLSELRSVNVSNGGTTTTSGAIDEIVMYASPAAITGTLWRVADDPTAAAGRRLYNDDLGAPKLTSAAASPTNYAELRFKAEAGKGYRLWLRGKAVNNNWANDSVFLQFSGSVDAVGTPRWRIGSTSATVVHIEQGVNAGLSGWGWSDNALDGDGPLVYFATSGDQVVRLQIREDGLSLDQVVLSAAKYLTSPPGAAKNDTTILAVTGSDPGPSPQPPPPPPPDPGPDPAPTNVPASYTVPTDRLARPKPPLPVLGSAGFRFTDPAFGSRLLRVTDGRTRPNAPDRSYRTPSASVQNAWNTTSRYFYVVTTDGNVVPFAFDSATMTAARINPTTTGAGGLTLDFFGEPQFSYVSEYSIYGAHRSGSMRTIREYNLQTGAYTLLLDLDTLGASLTGTYVGGVLSSAGAVEKILAWYGGTSQDRHYRVVVFERAAPSRRRVLDTLASTIDGVPTSTLLNFKLHHAQIDRSGRYVHLSPTTADQQAPRKAAPMYIWDTQTDVITPLPLLAALAGGHNALGFGSMVNQDCCTATTWDAVQWQIRSLAAPLSTRDVVTPVLLPQQVYLAEHTSWHNVRDGQAVPFVASLYRYGNNTTAWRAWDDEIVAVQTAPSTPTTVWRFAHHRTNVASDANPSNYHFWYLPRVNVSQDGRWAIFTSNWEKTLGIDAGLTSDYRQDVFAIELAAGSTAPPNQAPAVTLTTPVAGSVVTTGATVALAATATDADGSVANVDFFVNGVRVGSDTTAPYTASWTAVSAGSHALTAVAVDNAGAATTSAAIGITVVDPPPNQPPTVTLTTPAPGSVVTTGTTVALAATAADVDGIVAKVDFLVDGVPVGSDATSPYAASWTPASAGSYALTAVALDNVGATTTSAPVGISVVNPVAIVTAALPDGTVGVLYSQALEASGGLGSYTWSVTSGSLPAGLALSTAGVLSGVPSSAGSWTFTLTARDAADASRSASRTFSVAVAEKAANTPPTVAVTAPVAAARVWIGETVSVAASASDADGAVARVDFYANGAPIGSLTAPPYVVQWKVPAVGVFSLTARATDNAGASAASEPVDVVAVNEVVLYASDVAAMSGSYRLEGDATAAGGQRLATPEKKGRKALSVSARPPTYAEFTFYAEAGRPYHFWMRGRTEFDSLTSDSAYVQFSGAVTATGSPVLRIGTTDAATYELGTVAGLSGWGWEDNAPGQLAAPIYFATTGPQTVRLQPREDGLAVDQIVISPSRFLNSAPGAVRDDATIVAK